MMPEWKNEFQKELPLSDLISQLRKERFYRSSKEVPDEKMFDDFLYDGFTYGNSHKLLLINDEMLNVLDHFKFTQVNRIYSELGEYIGHSDTPYGKMFVLRNRGLGDLGYPAMILVDADHLNNIADGVHALYELEK